MLTFEILGILFLVLGWLVGWLVFSFLGPWKEIVHPGANKLSKKEPVHFFYSGH